LSGIYIHIPFCKQACHYCNFHFSTNTDRVEDMVDSIIAEIDLKSDFFPSDPIINTIYFGGGTPSILSERHLAKIISAIHGKYKVDPGVELTLEANPDDLTKEKLQQLKSVGINRLSIGVQSFHDAELQMMNRVHDANESTACVKTAQDVGITNISIDLIFGVQESTETSWQSNLDQAIALDVPHMSCYNLTVEPKTALHHFVQSGKMKDVDDALSAKQFEMTMDILGQHEYDHYEISNYAKDRKLSNHNTNYWRSVPYLGLGPAAHSFDGQHRSWNMANNSLYLQSIKMNISPATVEELSPNDRLNEYIMTGLRTKWGCDSDRFENIISGSSTKISNDALSFLDDGLLEQDGKVIRLTREGKFYADQIASDLFFV